MAIPKINLNYKVSMIRSTENGPPRNYNATQYNFKEIVKIFLFFLVPSGHGSRKWAGGRAQKNECVRQ